MAPPTQNRVDEQWVAEPSPDQISKEEIPSSKGIIAEKPRKTASKPNIVDKASKKKKLPANEKPEGDKSGENRSKKAKEKKAKQTAEVETRRSLAAQFFKAASPSENLDNFTFEDIEIINDSNGRKNGQLTSEHNLTDIRTNLPRFNDKPEQSRQPTIETNVREVTETVQQHRTDQLRSNKVTPQQNVGLTTSTETQLNNHLNAYITSPLHNNSNFANRQAFNRQTVEQQNFTDRETTTLGPKYSQVPLIRRQLQYHSPVNPYPDINDATIQATPNTNGFMVTGQFKPQQDMISAERMKPTASEQQNSKLTAVYQSPSEDFGGLIRSSMSLANGDVDDDIYMDYLDESPPLVTSNTPKCDNCEMLKKEIESLKANQMPGTSFFFYNCNHKFRVSTALQLYYFCTKKVLLHRSPSELIRHAYFPLCVCLASTKWVCHVGLTKLRLLIEFATAYLYKHNLHTLQNVDL